MNLRIGGVCSGFIVCEHPERYSNIKMHVWDTVSGVKLPNTKTYQTEKQTQTLHCKKTSPHKTVVFSLNRDNNLLAAQSHLFPLCKTCHRQLQPLNKVPLVTHHWRKQMFRLPLQKQTSDSGRWWNGADPKLLSHPSEPAKPAAAWSVPLTLPLRERK